MIYKQTYDPAVNAHYIYLLPPLSDGSYPAGVAVRTQQIRSDSETQTVLIDFDRFGNIFGIEILCGDTRRGGTDSDAA